MANLKISELAAGTLPMSGTELVPVVQGTATVYLPASALTPADVVRDDDSRLSDSRTPTGGAGGVLSGTYPNPGFAVDMATQGELDAHANSTSNPHATTAAQVGADPAGTAVAEVAVHAAAADPHTQYAKESDLGDSAALDVGTTAGTVAAGNDPRLSDSRTPTGSAGGVLSGTYPSPGFAVDMATQAELDAHANSTGNPHSVTKAQVGLGNVDNTADAAKSVASAATLTTPRTINGVSFNGSANITVYDSTKLPTAGGTMTGAITFAGGQTWPTFNQSTTGSAATLTTARTLTIGATGKTFNGSANVTWSLAEIGAAAKADADDNNLLTWMGL